MKTALLTTLVSAMLAGTAFGATVKDLAPAGEQPRPTFEREAPATVQQHLAGMTDKLELGARNAYWHGDYKLAAQYYHLLIKSGRGDCNDLYNLACCYGQMGDVNPAVKYLGLSVKAGFENTEHIRKDPDFQKIKDMPRFRKAVEQMFREISQREEPGSESMTGSANPVVDERMEPSGTPAAAGYGLAR